MKKYFLLFILSVVIFFLHAVLVRHAVYGDGNGYYSYTHALYFEKGLNFDYIYNHLGNFNGKDGIFSRIFWNKEPISDGLIRQNPFTIGTGIVWLPSMALVSLVSIFLNLGLDKYNLIYELGPGISGIFFMLSGLYFLEKYLVNFFSKRSVFWTILTLFFATNVFYYSTFEPALSHQPAFFLISFLLFWTYRFKGSLKNFFILGALAGLLVIVRMADAIVLVPVFFQVVRVRLDYKKVFMFLLGFTLLLTPQLLTQKLMYGYFFVNPYFSGQNGFWNISFSHFIEYLFSPKRGLFAWSPVFIPAVWGLFQKRSYVFLFTVFEILPSRCAIIFLLNFTEVSLSFIALAATPSLRQKPTPTEQRPVP